MISPTSAALLGQLAWTSQTTYELTKEMARNLHFLWPRAESHIYREVKRLVDDGLATAEPGTTGRRPKTTYAITDEGRAALGEWLASPPGGIALEHEPMMRVLLAGTGSVENLREAIAAARLHGETMQAIGRPLSAQYLDEAHPRQTEVHLRALTFDFLWSWAQLHIDWADRAEAEIARWTDLQPEPAKHRRALARLEGIVR